MRAQRRKKLDYGKYTMNLILWLLVSQLIARFNSCLNFIHQHIHLAVFIIITNESGKVRTAQCYRALEHQAVFYNEVLLDLIYMKLLLILWNTIIHTTKVFHLVRTLFSLFRTNNYNTLEIKKCERVP